MTERAISFFLNKYNLVEKLPSGAFGQVQTCENKETREMFVVKYISIEGVRSSCSSQRHNLDTCRKCKKEKKRCPVNCPRRCPNNEIYREIEILTKGSGCDFLVHVVEYFFQPNHDAIIVMEKFDIDSLDYTMMHGFGTMEELKILFRRIVEGLRFLHSDNIIHRDLKPENVLLRMSRFGRDLSKMDITKTAVLADFGCGRILSEDSLTAKIGTPEYKPPEVVEGLRYDDRWDIWGVGCTLFFCLFHKHPFPMHKVNKDGVKVMDPEGNKRVVEIRPKEPINEETVSDEDALSFLCNCLCPFDDRATSEDLVNHPFVQFDSEADFKLIDEVDDDIE
eukprot:m.15158 g.15158  ORF g.15158 m.15158 type:complete len:336 (-) comp4422_c0_seq1:250-1257(-)